MRISLLFGLLAGLSWAADLNAWDFDNTCTGQQAALQKAYDDAALLAAKALQDLQTIQSPRPRYTRANIPRIQEWDRVARAVTNMFGFVPDPAGHSPTETHLSNVLYVYNRMNQALQSSQNVPAGGYSGLHQKSMIMCGDSVWRWVGRNDADPYDPAGRPLSVSRATQIGANAGAWAYQERYMANGNPNSVGLCRPGIYAVTMTRYDFIVFCDASFAAQIAGTQSAIDGKNGAAVGDRVDTYGQFSLSRIMIHELAHWYGGAGTGTINERRVTDQQAVGNRGDLVWFDTAANRYVNQNPTGTLPRALTYFYTFCSRLARTNTGANAANSGPARATFTAEAYAYFAIMAYMDNFDWADDGRAKAIPVIAP
ncbi:hypothetical protein B0T10DRAFT_590429 [Thelonectria olida]|uniref:Lysine-specific metallo-endopeptidase domain-containing protein n=1 Tax=Thelonectria olida TaxID=1576542 RepID=A0A9P8W9J8_9HYPO|nr:hypothetical protein B0T10DRAFT_590429 [Thelonectria olida]